MQHIAENNISLINNYITDRPFPDIGHVRENDKAAIKKHIRLSFEYGTEAIRELSRENLLKEVGFFCKATPPLACIIYHPGLFGAPLWPGSDVSKHERNNSPKLPEMVPR